MKLKTSGLRKILTVAVSLLLMLVTGAAFLSLKGYYRAAASENSLLYRLNFENDADIGKNSAGTEFADAILPEGNSFTVEEGVKGGKALNFVGGTRDKNYLSLPTSLFENKDAVTISGWFYLPSGVDAYLGEIGIFSTENVAAFRADPYANYHGNAYIYCVGDPSGINLDTKVKPVYDAWYHMSYVIDGAAHKFTVYQNGAVVLTTDLAADFSPSQYCSADSHFYLGQSSYRGYDGEEAKDDYKGKMSDIRVYGSALTADSIKSEYSLEITDFLTAEYTFDSAETLYKDSVRGYDLASYKKDAVFSNGALRLADGAAVQAFNKATGQNDKFFDGHARLTVTMDLNIKTATGEHWKRVMDMFIAGDYRITYMAYCPRSNGNLFEITYNKGGDHNMLEDNSFTLPNNTWFNLTIGLDGKNLRVYSDGTLKVSAETLSDRPDFSGFVYDLANSEGGNFTIGSNTYEDNNWIAADYDNIRIYAAAAQNEEEVRAARAGYASYSLKYDPNGGDGNAVEELVKVGSSVIAAQNPFTKEGFAFVEWNTQADGKGEGYRAGESFAVTADTVLYAQWTIDSHFLSFEANGGRGEMNQQTIRYEETTAIADCGFVKTGHRFAGWNTQADGTGTAYADKAQIVLTEDITLYAQWTAKEYRVTFNANGGEGVMEAQSLVFGKASALTANAFTRRGYDFAGWAYTAEGIAALKDGESVDGILEGNDVQLYAVWTIGTFTVTFDANGGDGIMESLTVKAFSFADLTANAYTRVNYEFVGWAESADGEAIYADGAEIPLNSDKTLYAIWKEASGGDSSSEDSGSSENSSGSDSSEDSGSSTDSVSADSSTNGASSPSTGTGCKGCSGGISAGGFAAGAVMALGAALLLAKKNKR